MSVKKISQLSVPWITMKNSPTVNEIFRLFGEQYRKENPGLPLHEKKVMRAIEACRTQALGGRMLSCDHCGHTVVLYNSCRNRHCPQCQFMKKEQWIAKKKYQVFPFQYFHLVFTLPHQLIPIALGNKRAVYDLLFHSVKKTLLSVSQEGKYFGARIGFFAILHTWGQRMNLHPHLHCAVPGGGISGKKWIKSPRDFLLPVTVLKKRFRSLFLTDLKRLFESGKLSLEFSDFKNPVRFQALIDELFRTDWVVYVKESFRNSDSVLEYLGRYTHRIAMSNHRIKAITAENVSFTWKNYQEKNRKELMAISPNDFIRRFMHHVLPPRFIRIRYFGVMSNRNRR